MHLLEQARQVRSWSRTILALRLRELGASRGIPVGTRKDGVCRWENHRTPDKDTQLLIAELLGIPAQAITDHPWPHWLALDPLQQPTSYSWDAQGAIAALHEMSGRDSSMHRRTFITLTTGTLTASLWEWLTADPVAAGQIAQGRRLGEAAVSHIEQRVRDLRHADDTDGGGQLLTETAAAKDLVVNLLKNRTYTDPHGARLHAAAADLSRMNAWATFDVHDTCDDGVFEASLHAAHAASDTALGGHILAFWAIAAYNTGRAADAEAMIDTALAATRGRATPRVQAMLHSRRARARAHQLNPACWHDLDRAADLLADSEHRRDDDPDYVSWFDQSELLGALASTQLDMDQPDRADLTFAETASAFPPERVRTQALFLARRADAQWRQGEFEHACATAGQSLDLTEEISSHRSSGPLHDLAKRMRSHQAVPVVRDFRDRLATTLSAG
ncbi:XRE family transcriptional regulator [Streptomyces sp. NPDC058989]|uniref:XRE family transcriptional regulator n=1 Tax=Streptomyces sp. NPDC058989 TaxID=3346686 RepID=UPI00368C8675